MNKAVMTLLLMAASLAVLADGFSSLEEQMTGKEFSAAGLEKLSPQELNELNSWIRQHSLATLATPATKSTAAAAAAGKNGDTPKSDKDDGDRSTITSKLQGKFSGWDGQTVFKLENGMIWAQKSKKKFYTEEIENPLVIIEPGMFGVWRLRIEGIDEDVRVVRIQ
jgi:hypothetical protein